MWLNQVQFVSDLWLNHAQFLSNSSLIHAQFVSDNVVPLPKTSGSCCMTT